MSESEEMYLINIARLAEKTAQDCVSMTHLAEKMQVLPVSANQMVRKLAKGGLVTYLPYKGIRLTAAGKIRAGQVLGRRRLWETFLVQHLQFSADEAESISCRLEHVTSAEMADRLAVYLKHTQETPGGKTIPVEQNAQPEQPGDLLSGLKLDERGMITCINGSEFISTFLAGEGITPGQMISVMAIGSSGAMLVQTVEGRMAQLTPKITDFIQVKHFENPPAFQIPT